MKSLFFFFSLAFISCGGVEGASTGEQCSIVDEFRIKTGPEGTVSFERCDGKTWLVTGLVCEKGQEAFLSKDLTAAACKINGLTVKLDNVNYAELCPSVNANLFQKLLTGEGEVITKCDGRNLKFDFNCDTNADSVFISDDGKQARCTKNGLFIAPKVGNSPCSTENTFIQAFGGQESAAQCVKREDGELAWQINKVCQNNEKITVSSDSAICGQETTQVQEVTPIPEVTSEKEILKSLIKEPPVEVPTVGGSDNGLGGYFVFGIAVVGATVYAGTPTGLSVSTDNGKTWVTKKINEFPQGIVWLYYSDSTLIAVGQDTVGCFDLAFSKDGGNSWDFKDMNIPAAPPRVFLSDGKIYVTTFTGLLISSDGGNTWVNKTTNDGLGGNYLLSVVASKNKIYVSAIDDSLNNFTISVSLDGGNTWSVRKRGERSPSYYSNLKLLGTTLYAGSNFGDPTNPAHLLISSDDGNTWTNKPCAENTTGCPVINITEDIIYTASGLETDGLSISSDGGNTWAVHTFPGGSGVYDIAVSGSSIFLGTANGVVASLDGGTTWYHRTRQCTTEITTNCYDGVIFH